MDEQEAKKAEKKDLVSSDSDANGRNRGKHKSAEQMTDEDRAKGHTEGGQGEMPGEVIEGVDRTERPQKGFGKNHGKEGEDRSTAFGTRAPGGHHR